MNRQGRGNGRGLGRGRSGSTEGARLGRNRNPECPFYNVRWGK